MAGLRGADEVAGALGIEADDGEARCKRFEDNLTWSVYL